MAASYLNIDRAERHIRKKVLHIKAVISKNVFPIKLDESPKRRDACPGLSERLIGQCIKNNINALALRHSLDTFTKAQRARVEYMILGYAIAGHEIAFGIRAYRNEDLSAQMLRDLDCSLAETYISIRKYASTMSGREHRPTSSGGVNEHTLTLLYMGSVNQALVCRHENHGDSDTIFKRHIIW